MKTNQIAQVYDGYGLVHNYNYRSKIMEAAKVNMTAANALLEKNESKKILAGNCRGFK